MNIVEIPLTENQSQLLATLDQHLARQMKMTAKQLSFSKGIYVADHWVAGAVGRIDFQTFHLNLLATVEAFRGRGYGGALLAAAEDFAIANGCHLFTVTTQDFQARPFYEAHGFEVFATLEDAPFIGTTRYYLRKYLTTS